MQIKTLWAAARRRWYVVVAAVLLAASATYLVVEEVAVASIQAISRIRPRASRGVKLDVVVVVATG